MHTRPSITKQVLDRVKLDTTIKLALTLHVPISHWVDCRHLPEIYYGNHEVPEGQTGAESVSVFVWVNLIKTSLFSQTLELRLIKRIIPKWSYSGLWTILIYIPRSVYIFLAPRSRSKIKLDKLAHYRWYQAPDFYHFQLLAWVRAVVFLNRVSFDIPESLELSSEGSAPRSELIEFHGVCLCFSVSCCNDHGHLGFVWKQGTPKSTDSYVFFIVFSIKTVGVSLIFGQNLLLFY